MQENPIQILSLSEIYLSAEMLDLALHKLSFSATTFVTGSSNEAKYIMGNQNISIVIVDSYVMRNLHSEWIKTLIHSNKGISFILISYDAKEEEIFQWIDWGFSAIVNNSSLELAIAIKKEIRNLATARENQELEKKLRQSNQFLKLVFDHVPAGIFWKDIDSRYMGCNRLHANALHLNHSEEIIGKFDSDLPLQYSQEKLALFREDDIRVIADKRQISRVTKYEFQNPDGNVIWTETNKVPMHDEYGNIIGILGLYKDITKTMLLEKEVRKREEHYRTILESLSEGVIVYDAELNVINCNSSAERITGYSLCELMDGVHKKSKTELLNESGQTIEKSQLPHYITKNAMVSCSNVVIGFKYSEKKLQWLQFNTVPIFDEQMQISLIVSTIEDVTEGKIVNDKVISVKESLSDIFSNTHICFVYLDKNFNFIQVNEAYAKSCGHPPDYFIGKNHFELYPHEENEAIFKKVLETGEPFTIYAKPFSFPDHPEWGTTYWDWTLKPIKNIDESIEKLLFSLVDVTDNIKNQQKLQEKELLYTNIFSVMSESILVLNQKREIVTANPSGQKLLDTINQFRNSGGYLEYVNEDLTEIPFENYPSNITLQTGRSFQDQLIGIRINSTDYLWLTVKTRPIFAPDSSEVSMVVVSSQDVTEKKRISQELLFKKKMEAIGNMTSCIVHDFNNILQPIMLFSSMLKSDLATLTKNDKIDKLIRFADKIYLASVQGKNMIHQILRVNNKLPEVMQTVDLLKIMQDIKSEMEITKPSNIQIQFLTNLESIKLTANETSIRQVIYNLCQNSLHAMKNTTNGILFIQVDKIEIVKDTNNTGNESTSHFRYEIIVRDNGCGIKNENLEKLFEPYFTTKQNEGGTGLGLPSVYSIVQNLKGNISFKSQENLGTTFTIHLPVLDN